MPLSRRIAKNKGTLPASASAQLSGANAQQPTRKSVRLPSRRASAPMGIRTTSETSQASPTSSP